MMVTNSQGTQPPCMGLKRKIRRQNWEKGVRVGLHCLHKQSGLEMGEKGKVIAVLGFVMVQNKPKKKKKKQGFCRKWQGLGSKDITFLTEICLDLEVVLMLLLESFWSSSLFFPGLPLSVDCFFRRQCKAKTNCN